MVFDINIQIVRYNIKEIENKVNSNFFEGSYFYIGFTFYLLVKITNGFHVPTGVHPTPVCSVLCFPAIIASIGHFVLSSEFIQVSSGLSKGDH